MYKKGYWIKQTEGKDKRRRRNELKKETKRMKERDGKDKRTIRVG